MITSSIKELNSAKTKVAELEHALAKELASLPSAYGFNSLNSFVAAVAAAAGKGRAGRPTKAKAVKRRKRATITDAVRANVKRLVKAGKPGSHIAKALGISLPSVQNIKKALGLVKSHKKASSKPKGKKTSVKRKAAPKAKKKRTTPKKAVVSAPKATPAVADPPPAPAT
jgi:hypothetical protein